MAGGALLLAGLSAGAITCIVVGALVLVPILWFVAIYNGLVRRRLQVRNGWSQIDVQLKRRHDLIPNLVEAC